MRHAQCARLAGTCRGSSRAYALVETDNTKGALRSVVAAGEKVLPSELIPLRDFVGIIASESRFWVISWPFVTLPVSVKLFDEKQNELVSFSQTLKESKIRSRLLSLGKPELAALMRDSERVRGAGLPSIEVTGIWPRGEADKLVWRSRAVFPDASMGSGVDLRVLDAEGAEVSVAPIVMEDHVVPNSYDSYHSERIVSFSFSLDASVDYATLVASVNGASTFISVIPPLFAGLVQEADKCLGAAWADSNYVDWFEGRRVTAAELAWQRKHVDLLSVQPKFSLVMPIFNPNSDYLEAALSSIEVQSYEPWELIAVNVGDTSGAAAAVLANHASREARIRIVEEDNRSISDNTNIGIAAANGDYVCFMDHDDVLEPDCLWRYAEAISSNREVDLLYCDEDRLAGEAVHGPAFKPGYDHEKLCAYNYVTHLLAVSRWALEATERSGSDVAGAQDYDLTLRVTEVARGIVHIPRVLYHWREHEGSTAGGENQKPYAHEAGKLALSRHIARTGGWGEVADGKLPYTYRILPSVAAARPEVSIVIPSKDHAALLKRCVESILDKTKYSDYEIVVVENNSTESDTFSLYSLLQENPRVKVVTWQGVGFNYSALVNFGVAHASGNVFVLLNNDTEVIEPAWLSELVAMLSHPKVGVVGARLLFEDGLIQHAGMVANPNGDFAHMSQNLPGDCLGYGYSVAYPQEYSMVTGACQAVSREVYESLGGYDENLAVGFNDGDFCLRAREQGYTVVYCPYAVLYHREFSSRGRESADSSLASRYLREKSYVMGRHAEFFSKRDSAVNPNLDGFSDYWQLRWQ